MPLRFNGMNWSKWLHHALCDVYCCPMWLEKPEEEVWCRSQVCWRIVIVNAWIRCSQTRFFLDQGNGKMNCYCTLLAVSTVMWVTTQNLDQSRFLEIEFVVGLGWCQNCRHVHQKVVGALSLLMPFSFFFRYFLKPSTPQPCLFPSKLFSACE